MFLTNVNILIYNLRQICFTTHCDLSVKMEDKVYTSKVPRDIGARIGYIITLLEILHQMTIKRLFAEGELKQVLLTVSSTWKVDQSIVSF